MCRNQQDPAPIWENHDTGFTLFQENPIRRTYQRPTYLQKVEIFGQKLIKFIRDEDPSNIQLQVGLIGVIITLIKIMRSLWRHKQNSLKLNIAFSIEVTPCQGLLITKILKENNVQMIKTTVILWILFSYPNSESYASVPTIRDGSVPSLKSDRIWRTLPLSLPLDSAAI